MLHFVIASFYSKNGNCLEAGKPHLSTPLIDKSEGNLQKEKLTKTFNYFSIYSTF